MSKLFIFILIALATLVVGLALADEMTFTTYYPAPYGVYNNMAVMNSLGVGTTNPGQAVHIYKGHLNLDAGDNLASRQTTLNMLTKGNGQSSLGDPATQGWHLAARGDAWTDATQQNDLGLWFWDGSSWLLRMFIEHDTGNIGIGTATPATPGYSGAVTNGNLDVNDVWLRSVNQWVGNASSASSIKVYRLDASNNLIALTKPVIIVGEALITGRYLCGVIRGTDVQWFSTPLATTPNLALFCAKNYPIMSMSNAFRNDLIFSRASFFGSPCGDQVNYFLAIGEGK